ncbi:hypothetical protein [Brunnivagina elsteri]|uniref:Uncharacterized protein n=1 Tax=Brunnivagina elsteri CCALA 953 TaxID=987040 RepID=A0A2A2THY4_9CYAN|nr:hypothetical protein CK510_14430 [Calothrix elsteri CCALA 953]
MAALTLQLPMVLKFSDEQFEQLVAANQDLRLELSSSGELGFAEKVVFKADRESINNAYK